MPKLKYADHLARIAGCTCPPADAREATFSAFRFVWEPIDSKSFVPVALAPVPRVNRASQSPSGACAALGLSLFGSETAARKRFAQLAKTNPMIRETLGTHLAGVALLSEHGLQTPPTERQKHMTLFEYEAVDLSLVATVVDPPL